MLFEKHIFFKNHVTVFAAGYSNTYEKDSRIFLKAYVRIHNMTGVRMELERFNIQYNNTS
jgi:hypothetical protein